MHHTEYFKQNPNILKYPIQSIRAVILCTIEHCVYQKHMLFKVSGPFVETPCVF